MYNFQFSIKNFQELINYWTLIIDNYITYMLYTGTVIAESLLDESALNFVEQVKREHAQMIDAAADQPASVSIVKFTVRDEMAPAIAEELSRLIKPGRWYADVRHEFDVYVIFAGKIFHFAPKETEKRAKALEYAKTLGIPEKQLDF